jgi:hypothetical protein
MKWVKADRVKLEDDHNKAHNQVEEAIAERFPVAWDFLTGEFEIDDTRLGLELRMMFQFMADNWIESSKESMFTIKEWYDIFMALRYCAEEIGYLPRTKALDELRDNAKVLSGKILGANLIGGYHLAPTGITYEDLPLYPGDWTTILQSLFYTYKHIPEDHRDIFIRDLRKKIPRLAETIANRVARHEHVYLMKCGWTEMKIKRKIEDITLMPWEMKAKLRKEGKKAIETEYGGMEYVEIPLDQLNLIDPKEEWESRPPPFEGEAVEYPKDMEGIPGADYKILTRLQMKKVIEKPKKDDDGNK